MFTQADLEVIDNAIRKGERVVRMGETEIEYSSFEELRKRRAFIASQIASSEGKSKSRTTYASFSKGV